MCSIAGIFSAQGVDGLDLERVTLMNEVLKHRGPDSTGVWSAPDKKVVLGHNRLAIIDLTEGARQPFSSIDQRFMLAYNGEIYNYRELRIECETKGSIFKTDSDTEVVVETYRHFGPDAFKKFRGMWALALYDLAQGSLTLSRDPFGIKPLYYAKVGNRTVFASEPKALRIAFPDLNEVDEVTVKMFEDHGLLERGDWTFFREILRFPHAHFATFSDSIAKTNIQRYWFAPELAPNKHLSFSTTKKTLRVLLEKSVKLHLESDVRVGACLSGGIDSSGIVGLMSKENNKKIATFTTEFPNDSEINESEWAKLVINQVEAESHFIQPTYEQFEQLFDRVLFFQDEPFGSTSIFSQYFTFAAVQNARVKVVLDGQGADEIFGGYTGLITTYFKFLAQQHSLTSFLFRSLLLLVRYKIPASTLVAIWRERKSHFPTYSVDSDQSATESSDTYSKRMKMLTRFPATYREYLNDLVTETNLPQLLRYEDRDSMAHSVESRVPFLDPRLVEFGLTIPEKFLFRRGYTKFILRSALSSVLPKQVRTRVSKLGFPSPEQKWLSRLFGKEIVGVGSQEWRKYVVFRWRNMLQKDWHEFT